MIKMVTLECPKCGASLNADDREVFFCGHCGAKIMLHNENEHVYHIIKESKNTYRYIDETEIAKIEAEKQVKIKRIETDERKVKNKNTVQAAITMICIICPTLVILAFFICSCFIGE